jgi:hypothetical protein
MTMTLYAGDNKTWDVYVYKNGAALDLSGMLAATFLVKASVDDPDGAALMTRTLAAGITVVDAPGGHLRLKTAAADSVNMSSRDLACCLKLKDAAGDTHTVYDGPLAVVRPATRVAV